jgi:hypothetical protein
MTLVFGKPTGGSGGGGASAFTGLSDTPTSYSGQGGKATRVNAGESAVEFYTPTDANDAVKVSSNDTTAGFLNGKLLGGTNVTLVEGTDGGNETLTIDASVDISGKQNILSEGAFVDGDKTKLDAIEASADVTATAKFVKLTTTSTADANPSSEMKIAWDTLVIDEKDDAITHSISTNNSRITLDQDGYYRGFVNIGFDGSVVRGAPQVRVKVNDTTYLPEEARHTYIRATSGHNESTANFSFTFEASADDYIEITSIQGAMSGTLNIDGASLTIEKYEIGKQGEKGDTGSGGTVDVVSNVATDRILGRTTAGTGDSEQLTASAVRTLINVEDGATADQDLSGLLPKAGGTMTGNIALNGNYLSGDGGDEGVFVDSSGNVGIGTTAPNEKLDVYGNAAMDALYLYEGGEHTAAKRKKAYELTPYDGLSINIGEDAPNFFTVIDNSATVEEVFRIQQNYFFGGDILMNPNGNVGIGTTAPDTKLHVAGAMTQEPLSSDPADPDAGNSVQWVSDGTGSGSAGDVMMKINVGGTTKTVTLVDFSTLT